MYPKKADCVQKRFSQADIQWADGKIRVEFRYRTHAAVKQLLKLCIQRPPHELSVLTRHVSKKVLDPIETQMTVLLDEVKNGDPMVTLKKKYGPRCASA
jgi:hypothetical protein